MGEKIKNYLIIFGSALLVALFTVLYFVVSRSNSNGRRSGGTDERDTAIKEGLDGASATAERCEEHLRRAEEILRGAVERSRRRESEA